MCISYIFMPKADTIQLGISLGSPNRLFRGSIAPQMSLFVYIQDTIH